MDKKELFKAVTAVAAKSPAVKRKVGAIIVANGCVVAEGFNHTTDGSPCEDAEGNTKASVIHAEIAAARNCTAMFNTAKMYVTHQPCVDCETALKAMNLDYEVVEEFLKFDGHKTRLDLIPLSFYEAMEVGPSSLYLSMVNYIETKNVMFLDQIVTQSCDAFGMTEVIEGVGNVLTFGARKYKPTAAIASSIPTAISYLLQRKVSFLLRDSSNLLHS